MDDSASYPISVVLQVCAPEQPGHFASAFKVPCSVTHAPSCSRAVSLRNHVKKRKDVSECCNNYIYC